MLHELYSSPPLLLAAGLGASEADWLVRGIAVVGVLVGLAIGIRTLFFPSRGAPQPFIVRGEDRFMTREEAAEFKSDVHNQLRELRSYVHDGIHGLKNDLNVVGAGVKNSQEVTQEAIIEVRDQIVEAFKELDEKRSRSTGNLHEHLTATKERVAGVEASLRSLTQTTHQLDTKLDLLRSQVTAPRGPRSA